MNDTPNQSRNLGVEFNISFSLPRLVDCYLLTASHNSPLFSLSTTCYPLIHSSSLYLFNCSFSALVHLYSIEPEWFFFHVFQIWLCVYMYTQKHKLKHLTLFFIRIRTCDLKRPPARLSPASSLTSSQTKCFPSVLQTCAFICSSNLCSSNLLHLCIMVPPITLGLSK